MRILLLAAMAKELRLLLEQMPDAQKINDGKIILAKGKIGNHEVIAAQCGIGKVNSAIRTHHLINEFHPDMVINSGVAGGVDARMEIGSVLVADRAAYHDVWCGPGTKEGEADEQPMFFEADGNSLHIMKELQKKNKNVHFGLICSGDRFISKSEEVSKIKNLYPDAMGCDMESASIAHVCGMMNLPFVVIRVMSDMPGGKDNLSEYQNFWNEAPEKTFEAVSYLIENL